MNFLLLADITNLNELWNEAQSLQAEISPSWNQRLNVLQTVYSKGLATSRGEHVEWNGRKYAPLYTPKNSTLIDVFQIESAEMRFLSTIIDKEEKYRRKNQKRSTERRIKGSIPRERYEANSLTKKRPWESLGISRATWYRQGKPGV
jgi:hypothetical protein